MNTLTHTALAGSRRHPGTAKTSTTTTRAGKLFIAVLLIIVLEGALRKWVSNSLTLPLILLRDLLAIYTVWYAIRTGALSFKRFAAQCLLVWTGLLLLWGLLQLALNQFSPPVLLVGLRFWLLYFWFGYAAAVAMTAHDYRRSLEVMLMLLILMTPLVLLQQISPPGSILNTQIDTDVRDIFVVVAGVVRPTGTFSFTLGYTTFLSMAAPAVFAYREIAPRNTRSRLIFALAFVAVLVGSLLSGSRSAVIFYAVILGAYLLGAFWFSRGIGKVYALLAVFVTALLVGGAAVIFSGALNVTQERFETAAQEEDVGDRIVAICAGEPGTYSQITWLGAGLGRGSNLAVYFESGDGNFTLGETESARTLLEGGFFGMLFIALKMLILMAGLLAAWRASARGRSPGPLLVWISLAIALLTWSTIGQLTSNGATGVLFAQGLLALRYAPSVRRAREGRQPLADGPAPTGLAWERAR